MLTASRRLAEILTVSRKSPRLIEILMETGKIFRQGLLYQISRCCFAEDSYEIYKVLKCTC